MKAMEDEKRRQGQCRKVEGVDRVVICETRRQEEKLGVQPPVAFGWRAVRVDRLGARGV